MAKIFIATPMYGGMCSGFYTQSLLNLTQVLGAAGHEVVMSFMFNESLITRARNAIANQFMKSDATHLFFIDADIKFEAVDVPPMIDADKDIICGIYPKKEINWDFVKMAIKQDVPVDQLKYWTGSFVVNLAHYEGSVTVPVNEPVEIWNGGTGFMLIKRRVFEKLSKKVPTYINDVTDLAGQMGAEKIKEYFATSIEKGTNRLLSEDYHFCALWRKARGKIWAAPWARLSHVGTYVFDGKLLPAP